MRPKVPYTTWLERADGYFFPRENLSAATATKLEMLTLDDAAQAVDGGTLLPFEKSFDLAEEDAELLNLPPRNPYRISIRTKAYIGVKDFRFVTEFLQGDGRPLVKPQINGALLHVGEETFRLNADQFALINLVELGNKNLQSPLLSVKQMQGHAAQTDAQLDGYISEKNKTIIVPEKLDVAFVESGDRFKVQPVLLEKHGDKLEPIDGADFLSAFNNRKHVREIYRGKSGAQYVFSPTLQDGLKQIKSVDTLSKADADGERPTTLVLKIKENFERVDYATGLTPRGGSVFAGILLPDVKLLTHQIYGVAHMAQLWQKGWNGVLIADDMGLGKTLQTLTFIAGIKKFCDVHSPMLIVAPTALLKTWQDEYKKFLRGNIFGEPITLHGVALKSFCMNESKPNGKPKLSLRTLPPDSLALTTYETLRDYQFSFAEISWSCIIADEAQKIKNPDAGVTRALKAMKCEFAICLSGTPVENSWRDLWSIMDFVQPAHLDPLKAFTEKYIQRLTGDEENIRRLGTQLKDELKPLILRRMKEDYLSALPAKEVSICREEMPPYQAQIYSSVLAKYRRGKFRTPLDFLRELREVSLHPDIGTLSEEKFFDLSADEVIGRSARLIKTFALLDEIKARGEKVLVFVTSRKMQTILRRLLKIKFGMKILPPINGTMNGAERQRFIDDFKASAGFNVLILSPLAAGVGFTITEANNVIHLERTWNPAKENQATDRVYRIGQGKGVNVYLPLAVNKNLRGKTFDESLDKLLAYKIILSANVLFPTLATEDDDAKILTTMLGLDDGENNSTRHWTLEAVDAVTGFAFEQIVADLFDAMENFTAEKTPDSNDFGADVVVQSTADDTGLLIQCKHVTNGNGSVGKDGIQEICAAVAYYSNKYGGRRFQPVVITNSENFTSGARELADKNGVKLIARNELERLFANGKF